MKKKKRILICGSRILCPVKIFVKLRDNKQKSSVNIASESSRKKLLNNEFKPKASQKWRLNYKTQKHGRQ